MKRLIKTLIILCTISLLLGGCGNRPHVVGDDDNLIITNNTSQEFHAIGIDQRHSSGAAQYADGSSIKEGESFGIIMDKYDGCDFVITALDEDNNELFRSQQFTGDFAEGKVRISIIEDEDGKFYAEVEK